MAIEVETGKSDVVWNVKQDLMMGWKVRVATDDEARRKMESEDCSGSSKIRGAEKYLNSRILGL